MDALLTVIAPVVLAVVTLVVWMSVAIPERLWERLQLLPVRARDRRR